MRIPRSYRLAALGLLCIHCAPRLIAVTPSRTVAGNGVQKHVLIIDTRDVSRPAVYVALSGLERELRDSGQPPVVVHTRTIAPQPGFEAELRRLAENCASMPMAAIVTFPPLVDAVAAARDRYWPGVPLIYLTGVEAGAEVAPGNPRPPSSVPLQVGGSPRSAIEAALGLFPQARSIVIVGGASAFDRGQAEGVAREVRTLMPDLEIVDLSGQPVAAMVSRIAATPRDSVIFLTSFTFDGNKVEVVPSQMVQLFATRASAPIFDLADLSAGDRVVGTLGAGPERIGSEAGKLILRLAAGETADYIPPVRLEPELTLDWRQLQRFGVPAARIPARARILNRQATFWDSQRSWILVALTAFLAQALLIFILLAERRSRRQSQRQLAERLRYEQLASEISAGFANLPRDRMGEQIANSLRRMTEFLEVERITIWRYRAESDTLDRLSSCTVQGKDRIPRATLSSFPLTGLLKAGQPSRVGDTRALPSGSAVREVLAQDQIRSSLGIPLLSAGRMVGALACDTFTYARVWPESLVQSLQTLGELFANALALQESEEAARAGEELNNAVLASLPGYVAILNRDGVVLRVNDNWTRAEAGDERPAFLRLGVGSRYLSSPAVEVQEPLAAVLSRRRDSASVETRHPGPPELWFEIRIEALQRPQGGAVVSHVEITPTKRAEMHDARNRETIAHMSRVAAVSELASSIAHELRQPLGAIAINAAALEMELRASSSDAPDILSTVADIAADTTRAGEVISRMRSLLKKHDLSRTEISLDEVIQKAVRLVSRDAVARQVPIRLELAGSRLMVHSDPAQLQQVLLNLVANAMDAMAVNPRERRILTIRSLLWDGQAMVEVEDTGPGITPGDLDTIFDAFYTTKPNGLGVGLSVSRSIVTAHGGKLWAENRDAGAVFRCLLPLYQQDLTAGSVTGQKAAHAL